jgi:hypothetical protein
MNKASRILLNIAVLIIVASFIIYMIASVSQPEVEYAQGEDQPEEFETTCSVETSFAVPDNAKHMRLAGDTIFLASADSVYLYRKNGKPIHSFGVENGIADIRFAGGLLYILYPAKIIVTDPEGKPVREWEACSDNSLYTSITVTERYAFVTDSENKNICQYHASGTFIRFINSPQGFVIPSGSFSIESYRDTVYCANPGRHQVESYTDSGTFIASFGIPGSKPGTFSGCSNPHQITFTESGQLLASEKGNPRICMFERSGRFVQMMLNSKNLGGGRDAYQIQAASQRIYAAQPRLITVYTY